MPGVPLTSLLRDAKLNARPITLTLAGGQVRELLVRSVGNSWFSAAEPGDGGGEFVVSLNGVRMISHPCVETVPFRLTAQAIPISAMLLQLKRQHTAVVVHLSEVILRGSIIEVGRDFFALKRSDDAQVIVPLTAFLWLEACG